MGSNDTFGVRTGADSVRAESERALIAARELLDRHQKVLMGNAKIESEFFYLGYITRAERVMAVDVALSEIKPEDRCGPNPPNNISGAPYYGHVMYAFKWKSPEHENKTMYLKFCMSGLQNDLLVILSFHEAKWA